MSRINKIKVQGQSYDIEDVSKQKILKPDDSIIITEDGSIGVNDNRMGFYTIVETIGTSFTSGKLKLNENLTNKLIAVYNDAKAKDYDAIGIKILDKPAKPNGYTSLPYIELFGKARIINGVWDSMITLTPIRFYPGFGGTQANRSLYATLRLYGSEVDNKFVPSSYTYNGSFSYLGVTDVNDLKNYLSITNTTAYTPTYQYHPATKGYVDNITGKLENLNTEEKANLVNAINEINDNVMIVPIINVNGDGTTKANALTNIERVQAILPYIGKKDIILRSIEPDDATYNGIKHRLFFLSPMEYKDIEDITTYSGELSWESSNDRYVDFFDGKLYLMDGRKNIRVTIENGQVIELYGSGGGSGSYTATKDLQVLHKTNTKEYTPTDDYNPATKIYVDNANNVKFFYEYETAEKMQLVVDALRAGKKVILVPKGRAKSKSYGYFEDALFYGPDVTDIDWETFSGKLYFKSDWWLTSYNNSYWKNRVDLVPKWQYITVTITAGGVVSSVATNGWSVHNNIGNICATLPVLGLSNEVEYTPTKDYHPATKLYVDNFGKTVKEFIDSQQTTQELVDEGFNYKTGDDTTPINYTVTDISETYKFALNDNGYYESGNKGVNGSWSLCRVTFNNEIDMDVTIDYISYGENAYDYGIFSKLDTSLTNTATDDGATGSDKVEKNCKGEASADVKQLTYHIPAGEHFIEIKYRKDNSSNNGNDSLQFKIPTGIVVPIYENRKLATEHYVDEALGSGGGLTTYTLADLISQDAADQISMLENKEYIFDLTAGEAVLNQEALLQIITESPTSYLLYWKPTGEEYYANYILNGYMGYQEDSYYEYNGKQITYAEHVELMTSGTADYNLLEICFGELSAYNIRGDVTQVVRILPMISMQALIDGAEEPTKLKVVVKNSTSTTQDYVDEKIGDIETILATLVTVEEEVTE